MPIINNGDMETLRKVAKRFELGEIKSYEKLSGGITNDTFKIITNQGIFVAQRINKFFPKSTAVRQHLASNHLRNHQFFDIPQLIKDSDLSLTIRIKNHNWRVSHYIDHDKVEKNLPLVVKAASKLGKFHKIMSKYDSSINKPSVVNFHNTKRIIEKLISTATLASKSQSRKDKIKAQRTRNQISFISENAPKHYLPKKLPKIIIHGDPKFENFLFKNGKVVALMDLDTLMKANELIDIGDALRSWSIKNHDKFDKKIFDAALKAYLTQNKKNYINGKTALNATLLITMELAARFMIDYFKESYFQWGPQKYSSAADHNLTCCNKMLSYYQNILKYLK